MEKEQEVHSLLLRVAINELEKEPADSSVDTDIQPIITNVMQLYTMYINNHSDMLRLLFQTAINAKHRNSHNIIKEWVAGVRLVIETEVITLYKYGTNFKLNFQELTYQTVMDYLTYDYVDVPESQLM